MGVRSSVSALLIVLVSLAGRSAFAQADISGEWGNLLHEDVNHRNDAIGGGPRIGDYTGLPINDAARLRADSWDAAINTIREHQTVFAPAAYWARGGGGLRISKVVNDETQQLIAYKIYKAGAGGSDTPGDDNGLPSISTVPDVGVTKPAIIRSVVVLPQPDGPSSETNSPSSSVRSTPCTAITDP